MAIRIESLAKALGVSTEISEEDFQEASKILEENNFLESIDVACNIIIAGRVLERISELAQKVDKL
jgi:hypothetical protein